MSKRYENGENVTAEYDEQCPQHGGDMRKWYTFGRYGDAEVHVYSGCQCACAMVNGGGFGSTVYYYTSYAAAAGRAAMRKAEAAALGY